MKIVRQSETEIVVQDSSIWIFGICAAAFLFVAYMTLSAGNHKGLAASGLLLVFAIAWLRRSTFVFDTTARMIRWRRMRYLNVLSGAIHFSDVQDIVLDSTMSGKSSVMIYRLTIVTALGRTPMSDVFKGGHDHISAMRETLLGFIAGRHNAVNPAASLPQSSGATNSDAERAAQLNEAIRGLLKQGRKIDAILLVQSTDHLDLTEATFRVNQIANKPESRSVRQ